MKHKMLSLYSTFLYIFKALTSRGYIYKWCHELPDKCWQLPDTPHWHHFSNSRPDNQDIWVAVPFCHSGHPKTWIVKKFLRNCKFSIITPSPKYFFFLWGFFGDNIRWALIVYWLIDTALIGKYSMIPYLKFWPNETS